MVFRRIFFRVCKSNITPYPRDWLHLLVPPLSNMSCKVLIGNRWIIMTPAFDLFQVQKYMRIVGMNAIFAPKQMNL